jgi:peptidoglycan-associated lipoprotein
MKKTILLCAGLFLIFGCAKKQIVKPTSIIPETMQEEPSKDETSVRFDDWTQVPQLEAVHFDYDKFQLQPEDRAILKKNAQYLLENTGLSILVDGHCDERGTIGYNLALGQKRAASVREYYGQLGVRLDRIGTISYGSEKPLDPGHTEEAWAKNRRAETKIRNK